MKQRPASGYVAISRQTGMYNGQPEYRISSKHGGLMTRDCLNKFEYIENRRCLFSVLFIVPGPSRLLELYCGRIGNNLQNSLNDLENRNKSIKLNCIVSTPTDVKQFRSISDNSEILFC